MRLVRKERTMKRLRGISSLVFIIVILFSIQLIAQTSHPAGVKKYKPTKLKYSSEGDFSTVFNIITFDSESGVSPAIGGPGFGLFAKDTFKIGDKKFRHIRFLGFDYKGKLKLNQLAYENVDGGILDTDVIHTPYGWFGVVLVVDKDGKQLQVIGFPMDEFGNMAGVPVVLEKIDVPEPMKNGYTSKISNAGVNIYGMQGGTVVSTHANFAETMGSSYIPAGWEVVNSNVPSTLPLTSNSQKYRNSAANPYSVFIRRNRSKPRSAKEWFQRLEQIAAIQNWIDQDGSMILDDARVVRQGAKIEFAPAAKAKLTTLAKSEKGAFGDFPRQQFLEGDGDVPNMAFYQYWQSIPYGEDDMDSFKSEYYLQDLDGKGRAKGDRRMITMPEWKHRLKRGDNTFILRHRERISNLAPLTDGRFLCLQTRSLELRKDSAPNSIMPTAKPKMTELEANILLFDPDAMEMKLAGTVKLKYGEGDWLTNAQAAVGGKYAVFYYELIDGETFDISGYFLSIKYKKLTRRN